MNSEVSGAILVLDDDASFRNMVAALLDCRGFEVLEAASPAEADRHIERKKIALAVVDYRLPQTDGMSWITKLRESGQNVPIVFCSALSCDAKTFNWLRNILHVALIVQKPIIPATFVQQVESLLPNYQRHTDESEGISEIKNRSLQTDIFDYERKAFMKRMKLERALDNAKAAYADQMETSWRELTEKIGRREEGSAAINSAVSIAHTLRGTAGSLGFSEVGEIAGKLEDLLRNADPDDTTSGEVVWSEVMRAHAKGDSLVRAAVKEARSMQAEPERSIMLLSGDTEVLEAGGEFNGYHKDFELELLSSYDQLSEHLQSHRIDGVIFDTGMGGDDLIPLSKTLRAIPGYETLQLGAIVPEEQGVLDKASLMYAGVNYTITRPVTVEDLDYCGKSLMQIHNPAQFRVLTVDDDEILCEFISKVLRDERIHTQSCTNPMEAVDLIDSFNPDLIMLDVMMPGLTGYEVCRIIKQNEKWARIPVIFLTSRIDPDARAAAFAAGASDFLGKPVLASELSARVQSQLSIASRKGSNKARDAESGLLLSDALLPISSGMLKECESDGKTMSMALLVIRDTEQIMLKHGPDAAHHVSLALALLLASRFRIDDLRVKWSESVYALVFKDATTRETIATLQLLKEEFESYEFEGTDGRFGATFEFSASDSKEAGNSIADILRTAHSNLAGRLATASG